MAKLTKGRRIADDPQGLDFEPGDYFRVRGEWHGCCPTGYLAGLGNHEVVEHEDGTITVSPSILCEGVGAWHGYLERGNWREC